MITKLRRLWKQAFGDTDAFLDSFFALAYSPDRCRYLTVDGKLAAALYWFDCQWEDKKLAYLYAVATDEQFKGQGLCRKLMEQTHIDLQKQGYAGAVLVPGSRELFRLYEKLGYRTFCQVREFTCAAGTPVSLRTLSAADYAALRQKLLPPGGILQEGVTLDFLATQAQFYAGADFVLAATKDGSTLHVQELLGNSDAAPSIVAALGAVEGRFRTPGQDNPFAMLHAFSACPQPNYLGIALD